MTDLETAIHDALQSRAEAVAIRHTTPLARRRRWVAPALAAALVIALVAITLAVLHHKPAATTPATRTSSFVGYRWRLVSIDDSQGHLTLPASTKAAVAFGSRAKMTGSDTVNTLSAHYRIVASGYAPDGMTVSGTGFAGAVTAALKRTLGAVGSCFSSPQAGSKPPATTPVRASVSGTRLVLHTSYGVLTFVRAGPAPSR
ncbi:MAG TPA: hypothetical protein VGH43_02780 [Jatrophihabitans sp.]|jgi:hypothetical protein